MKQENTGLIVLIAAAVSAIFLYFFYQFLKTKRNKEDLANDYAISKPTLANWAEHFQNDIPLDQWKRKRNFSIFEVSMLKKAWGSEKQFVLNKKQIAERADSDYKTIAENVIKNINKIGISKEAWKSSSVFPPAVSKRILEVLG